MSDNFFRLHRGLNFTPQLGTPANLLPGDIWYLNSSNKFQFRLNAVTDNVVGETTSAALTNKTISGASNTLSNITYSSLAIANSILGSDIATTAAIGYSKLSLSNSIVSGDIAAAGLAYNKLALANSIINADIFSTAAIDGTKISPNFGSQTVSTTGNVTVGGVLSTTAGTDNTGTGTLNDVSSANTSFFRFTNNTGPTITGLANGTNGKRLTLSYTGSGTMQVNNADALSIPANRIDTGTGNNLTIQTGANLELIYDNAASLWRVIGGTGGILSTAISSWQSFSPTWTGTGSNPVIGNGFLTGHWRQVGDSIEIDIEMKSNTTTTFGTGDWQFDLPNGFHRDDTKIIYGRESLGVAQIYQAPGNNWFIRPVVSGGSSWNIVISNNEESTFVNATAPFVWAADGSTLLLRATIPVIGLSANINVQNANEEFAFNTGSVTAADGSDITSFGYGANGTLINSFDSVTLTKNTSLRCRFTTPIQVTDIIRVEIWDTSEQAWTGVDSSLLRYTSLNQARYGIGWGGISGNSTDITVVFGNSGATSLLNTYGGTNGDAWSLYNAAGHKWRVRKVSAPGVVGFQPTSADVKGLIVGSEAPTGYIGEYQEAKSAASSSFTTSNNFGDMGGSGAALTLSPGDWDLTLIATLNTNSASVTRWLIGIGTAPNNSSAGLDAGDTYISAAAPTPNGESAACIAGVRKNITVTTSFYAKYIGVYTLNTPIYSYRFSARRVR